MNRCALIVAIVLVLPAFMPAVVQADESGQTQQRPETLLILQQLADQGDPGAQLLLGGVHDRGEGVPQDHEQAVSWWRKAAEQGLADAQNELGAALAEGRGVPQDLQQAMQWFRRAAEQGHAVAQTSLGNMYWNGDGVRRNRRQAVEWYHKAAEQGLAWAQLFLGDAYSDGASMPVDRKQAAEWYRKAADQDYPEAQYKLGTTPQLLSSLDIRDGTLLETYGTYWVARAARSGYAPATARLAGMVLLACNQVRLPAAIAVRSLPDANAPVVRHAAAREQACRLDDPRGPRRVRNWAVVYLPEEHTVGFINTEELRAR